MSDVMRYPMKSNTERPLFNYLVRYNMKMDYYLFCDFNDAVRQAEKMSLFGEDTIVLIYENYFDTRTREWKGQNTFEVIEGKILYDKHARVDLHLNFYVNAGEWLNPNEEWISILNDYIKRRK